MFSFARTWKGLAAAIATAASLLGLGAVAHGGLTVYATTSSVKALEARTLALEVSQNKVTDKLDSVSEKLDLAIELLGGPNRHNGK
jgi:hypothetical protein